MIVLRIVHLCVNRFAKKETPASDIDIAYEIKIPLKIVKVLLAKLIECNVLLEVNRRDSIGYVPASDIEGLTILDVLTAFEQRGDDIIQARDATELKALEESLNEFTKACRLSSGERNFKNI